MNPIYLLSSVVLICIVLLIRNRFNLRFVGGYLDTRSNNEDMAITPYIGLVFVNESTKCYGLSLTWIFYSLFIGIAVNAPKELKAFRKY